MNIFKSIKNIKLNLSNSFIWILPGFYRNFIGILSGFYRNFIGILSGFYRNFIGISSGFYRDFIGIWTKKVYVVHFSDEKGQISSTFWTKFILSGRNVSFSVQEVDEICLFRPKSGRNLSFFVRKVGDICLLVQKVDEM